MATFWQYSEKLVEELRAFFFARDRDIHLQSGRKLILGSGTVISDVVDAEYVVMSTTANLANERQLTAGDGLDLTDGGAGGNATLDVDVTDFIDTAAGLTESSNNIQVNLGAGLTFDGGGAIQVGSTTGHIIQEEGVDLTAETYLNFRGAYVTAADDAGNSATTVDILEDTETANTVLAGPASGGDAKPAFRALVEDDLPDGAFVPIGGIILWSGSIVSIPTNWALCDGLNGTPDLTDRFVIGAGDTYSPDDTGGSTTTDVSHTHGSGTLATDSDGHTHGVGTLATDSDGHTHGVGTLATDSDNHSHSGGSLVTGNDNHQHDVVTTAGSGFVLGTDTDLITDSDTHAHGSFSGATASDSHSHSVTSGATASDSHSHSVNSGATASDSHSHSVNSGATASDGSAAQDILNPYYALAYIMRTA